jgi:hypothetical protein
VSADNLVPFVAVACPSCGEVKPRTYGHRGPIRYHACKACGSRFRSFEVDGSAIAEHLSAAAQAQPDPNRITLAEVAELLCTPPAAVRAAITDTAARVAPLIAAGFPRPIACTPGAELVWHRCEVAAHLIDANRAQRARHAALAGFVGLPVAVDEGPLAPRPRVAPSTAARDAEPQPQPSQEPMTTNAPATIPTIQLAEVAQLLQAPAYAVASAIADMPRRPSPLLLAGFPAPTRTGGAATTWRRADDAARLEGARQAVRACFVGLPFVI